MATGVVLIVRAFVLVNVVPTADVMLTGSENEILSVTVS